MGRRTVKAVIMAGGKGTRLQSVNKEIPKPMFPVEGRPVLEYQLESLKKNGITDITVVTGYLGRNISGYFGNGHKWNVCISYIEEAVPLGSGGALYYLRNGLDDDFLFIFGDLVFDVDFGRFMNFHKKSGALITLYAHPNSHPFDSDLIVTDSEGKVKGILPKNTRRNFYYHNTVNAGLYCISQKLLEEYVSVKKLDFEKDILAGQIEQGVVSAYQSAEYVKDMGTPDRLEEVQKDIRSGLVQKRSLKNRQKAVFLEFSSMVDISRELPGQKKGFTLMKSAAGAVRRLNRSEFLAIIVIGQTVLYQAGYYAEEADAVQKKMETELGEERAYADAFFFCPDRLDKSFRTEITELADRFNISLADSYYVCNTADMQNETGTEMTKMLVQNVLADGTSAGFMDTAEMIAESI